MCDKCPRCGEVETPWHRYYYCPKNAELQHEDVQRSQHLCRIVSNTPAPSPCFYLRGIIPEHWVTFKAPTEHFEAHCYNLDPGPLACDNTAHVFVDGSGGPNSSFPKLRRCGWGVAQCEKQHLDGAFVPVEAMYGPLPGEAQTVPRAEVLAAAVAIEFWQRSHITVYSDHKPLLDIVHNRPVEKWSFGENSDLWTRLQQAYIAHPHGVSFRKVKSHCTNTDIIMGQITLHEFIGDFLAGKAAGQGAA